MVKKLSLKVEKLEKNDIRRNTRGCGVMTKFPLKAQSTGQRENLGTNEGKKRITIKRKRKASYNNKDKQNIDRKKDGRNTSFVNENKHLNPK